MYYFDMISYYFIKKEKKGISQNTTDIRRAVFTTVIYQ